MSVDRATAAVERSLRSEYTPFVLGSPLRRAHYNNLIGWVLIASGVALLVVTIPTLATGGATTFAQVSLVVGGLVGVVTLLLGWVMLRASLQLCADGRVMVRGLRTRTFDARDVAGFELGILPWSGSHRGPAPIMHLRSGGTVAIRALNHSPLSFPSEFDSEVVRMICAELEHLLAPLREQSPSRR